MIDSFVQAGSPSAVCLMERLGSVYTVNVLLDYNTKFVKRGQLHGRVLLAFIKAPLICCIAR